MKLKNLGYKILFICIGIIAWIYSILDKITKPKRKKEEKEIEKGYS